MDEEQQWSLFGRQKYMMDTFVLAKQYTMLLKEKGARERPEQTFTSAEAADSPSAPPQWPDVDHQDFAGLTN